MTVAGLFGISGIGKSHLSELLKKQYPRYFFSSASKIIKNKQGIIDYHKLNDKKVGLNQQILLEGIELLRGQYDFVFLELHLFVEIPKKDLFVGGETLKSMNIDLPIFIEEKPCTIYKNRKNDKTKVRPYKSNNELKLLQSNALIEFKRLYPEGYIFTESHIKNICKAIDTYIVSSRS